jgi:MFS family permease
VAPLIGGWLAGALSYQWMFVLTAVIGALGWVLMRFAVREPRKKAAPALSSEQAA